MLEHAATEYRVYAVAGMDDQILPQPGHDGRERHEQRHADSDHLQGRESLMDHDLVDDNLGEERETQAEQLDGQRGDQHIAPDAFVPEEFRDEPAEAEGSAN